MATGINCSATTLSCGAQIGASAHPPFRDQIFELLWNSQKPGFPKIKHTVYQLRFRPFILLPGSLGEELGHGLRFVRLQEFRVTSQESWLMSSSLQFA